MKSNEVEVKNSWYKECCRRVLVDCHIPEHNEEFLSKFNPDEYVDMMALANASSITRKEVLVR